MSSLKEVKTRIASVATTRKITQARQMIASAKLHRAQDELDRLRSYSDELMQLLRMAAPASEDDTPSAPRNGALGRAVIIFSSDSGMCGSFNSRMIKESERISHTAGSEEITFYPIGNKIADALRKAQHPTAERSALSHDKASTSDMESIMDELSAQFQEGRVRSVEVAYCDFHTVGSQQVMCQTLLPVDLGAASDEKAVEPDEFIFEPSPGQVVSRLVPLLLRAELCTAIASSRTSEHAVRMVAMLAATENADDLLDELNLSYNKLRQQNITSEMLDIIGGSFA